MIINGVDFGLKFDSAFARLDENIDIVAAKAIEDILDVESSQEMIDDNRDFLIISNGNSWNTKVYSNGVEMKNISSISLDKIDASDKTIWKATIEVLMPSVHIRVKGNIVAD